MRCLVESHDMLCFIDGSLENPLMNKDSKHKADKTTKYREWKRSDSLVKGWIFGSLSEDVMETVVGLDTSNNVWKKLNTTYSTTPPAPPTKDWREYRGLYEAILDGDWDKARDIFMKNKDALTVKINDHQDTPLHVAVSTCQNVHFVENLLKEIIDPKALLNLVNNDRLNVLHRAAQVGNTKAAEMLVNKNRDLLFIKDYHGYLPIHRAIFGAHGETFLYLLKVTKEHISLSEQNGYHSPFKGKNSAVLLATIIREGFLDAAYELIKEYPDMARSKRGDSIPLKFIAGKLDSYSSGRCYNNYQRFVYSHLLKDSDDLDHADEIQDIENEGKDKPKVVVKRRRSRFHYVIRKIYVTFWKVALPYVPQIKHLQKDKVKHNTTLTVLKCICEQVNKITSVADIREHYLEAITHALENDIPEAIEEITKSFPQVISTLMHNGYHLNQLAIINRCEKVYSFLVHQVVPDKHFHKVWLDKDKNNLLHLAGKLAPIDKLNLVSGAALQMQRELQWFEEVKKFVLDKHNTTKNKNQETPIMVFRREHKDLRKEGEEWMKKTADSYTITAALIITIVFAAAITVPGGNDGNTGKAIFANKSSFIIFAVSDAISLFSSTTSLLLFLSILTARYRDEDFLYRLPKRLILGLAMLFLSVTSMMIAFSTTLYIMFGQEKAWILIPIAALTCLPVASFMTLQLPLLAELICSTYGQGIFSKQSYNHSRIK
ncbi:hypothetical protein L6452_30674 [Arctium lappa]|uniref:Uncharacterized protein n=1 Tax=Arctium lappa TaxID=4217 RepID=A0ACB8ZIL5_ARCLA|nr:hypothetical protein L6452_30674 [Arctium lappa]